jgi:protein SCO1/2
MPRLPLLFAPLLVSGVLAIAACGPRDAQTGDGAAADANAASGFRGVITAPPREKPDFTLTDVNGQPFNFRLQTNGKVTLLFFGYTHCPDVCPLHVANVAAVLKKLPFEARDAIRFVFVSTDPDRDTPERLKEWLGSFDPSFIGLRGTVAEVNRILYGMRMPPIDLSQAPSGGSEYLVGHAAQVVAFGIDGLSRLEYPFGIRQEDWAHDLPKLARGELPAGASPSGPGSVDLKPLGANATVPDVAIRVAAALVPQPATTTEGALYLVLRHNGAVDDTLYAVSSAAVQRAELHETTPGDHQAMGHMMPTPTVVVRPGETLQLLPGARHVMLLGFNTRPQVGETIPVRLHFRRAGEVILAANVVAYADLERMLAAAAASLAQ